MRDIFAKNMQKFSWKIIGGIVGAGVIIGGVFALVQKEQNTHTEKLVVAATFFPYASIAEIIGGDAVEVKQTTPDGVEVHDYDPSPRDIAEILESDIVLMNGGGIDSWVEKIEEDIKKKEVALIKMSDVVSLLSAEEEGEHEEDHHEEDHEDAHMHEGEEDPHAWLDLVRMQEMAREIGKVMSEKDPKNSAVYEENTASLIESLGNLHEAFGKTLASCETKNVLVAHDAFRYWEERYTINVHAIAGISPEAEPSLQNMAKLIEEAEELGVNTVFFESPASSALAETIAQEIGAQVAVLSTLEGRTENQQEKGENYLAIMQNNLASLAKGLSCTK